MLVARAITVYWYDTINIETVKKIVEELKISNVAEINQ